MNASLLSILLILLLVSTVIAVLTAFLVRGPAASTSSGINWSTVTPRRSTYLILAFASTIFVVYGGFLPFQYRELSLEEAVTAFRGIRLLGIQLQQERADLIATTLLWMPLAFFWMGGLTVDECSPGYRAMVAPVVGGALTLAAVALEFGQQWFPPRTISQNDIYAAAFGAQLGVLVWLILGQQVTQAVRGFTRAPGLWARQSWLLWAYAGAIFFYWLIPLDFTISWRELTIKYRVGNIELEPFSAFLSGRISAITLLLNALLWVPVGILAGQRAVEVVDLATPPEELKRRDIQRLALRFLVALGVGLLAETLRLFVYTRFSSVTHLFLIAVGILLGVYLARRGAVWWEAGSRHPLGRILRYEHWPWSFLVVLYLAVLFFIMYRSAPTNSNPEWTAPRFDHLFEMPLASAYYNSKFVALNSIIHKQLIFFPLGLLLAHSLPAAARYPTWRRLLLAVGIFMVAGTAAAIELLQVFQTRHFATSTDVLLAASGTLVGVILHDLVLPAPRSQQVSGLSWVGYGCYLIVLIATCGVTTRNWQSLHTQQLQRGRQAEAVNLADVDWEETAQTTDDVSSLPNSTSSATPPGPTNPQLNPNPALPNTPPPNATSPSTGPAPTVPAAAALAVDPREVPRFTSIPLPELPGALAVWGATGSDRRGHIWFAMSMESPTADDSTRRTPLPAGQPSRLFEYQPITGELTDRGDVLTALRAAKLDRSGISQTTIHTRIVQGPDGHLYFCSSDEIGEDVNGTTLPRWGSHLWRYRLPDHQWEHLLAVPEALITLAIQGEHLYALGYFQHVLYHYHLPTGEHRSVRVGAVDGHFSRNLMVDHRAHAYVPRLSRSRSGGGTNVQISLAELDPQLKVIGETLLANYTQRNFTDSHGIVAWQPLANQSIVFATDSGYLYEINSATLPAVVREIGYFHPRGNSYVNSLFALPAEPGRQTLVGIAQVPLISSTTTPRDSVTPALSPPVATRYEWVVFDLASGRGEAYELPADSPLHQANYLTGSITRDNQGSIYIAGEGQSSSLNLTRDLTRALQAIGGEQFEIESLRSVNRIRSGPLLLRGDLGVDRRAPRP